MQAITHHHTPRKATIMHQLPVFTPDRSRVGDVWSATVGDILLTQWGEGESEAVSVYRIADTGTETHIGKILIDRGTYSTTYRIHLPFATESIVIIGKDRLNDAFSIIYENEAKA